jgi:hypothetical protein
MEQLALFGADVQPGIVYYATDGCNIKIGYTRRPARRRGGELGVTILYTEPGSELDERRAFDIWHRYRISRSEWFRPGDDLLLWLITQLVAEGKYRELAVLRQVILGAKRKDAA